MAEIIGGLWLSTTVLNSGPMIVVLAICIRFFSPLFMLRSDSYLITFGPVVGGGVLNPSSPLQLNKGLFGIYSVTSLSWWRMFRLWMRRTIPVCQWNSKEMVISPFERVAPIAVIPHYKTEQISPVTFPVSHQLFPYPT
jgi:hypothetical protein